MSITGFNINGEIKRYDYESLDNQPDIPTKNSQLENDNKFITLADVPKTDLSEYAKRSEIPDVSKFITGIPSEYVTETELNAKGYLIEHQSLEGYATENYVKNAIAEAELSGSDEPIDLSGYATKDDIKKFITEIPEEYITESELNNKGYLTEHQSLEGLATEDYVNTKVNIFHATLDNSNFQYVKDSADFTYADVVATENCKIEATFGNIKIILNKEVHRNIEPDPIAGRYVEFSALMRSAGKDFKVFLFVYDPESLPTDEESVSKLETWGDSQYCSVGLHTIVLGEFLDKSVSENRNSDTTVPSTKAIGDYTDSQCGVVLDYMQTTFANNIMALCNDRFGPHVIYDNPTGFEASNDDAGETWHLTGLNLSPYKRIKCYVCAGGDGDANYSPPHTVEVDLDNRAKGSFGYFFGSHAAHCPNNRNRHHIASFTVNAEKTAIQFQHSISIYGTAASNSVGGRRCYLIEGYYI